MGVNFIVTAAVNPSESTIAIRRDEFSSDVYKDFAVTSKGKLASKRFLLEDLKLLVEFGIRKGPKLTKDKIRLKRFIEGVLKAEVPKGASFDTMIKIAMRRVPTLKRTPRLTLKAFPINDWRKFYPSKYESIISPVSKSQVVFLLYPLINAVKGFKKVPVDYRFNALKAHWTLIKNNQYRGNLMKVRPNKEAKITMTSSEINKIRNNVLRILKKGKIPMPSVLYGYVPGRDDWMPTGLIDKAAMIGILGQLK